MTKKELVRIYCAGKMTSSIFRALSKVKAPMTEDQLKEELGLKRVNVLRAVLNDLSSPSRGESVVYDKQAGTYSLTEFGRALAKKMSNK